MEKVRIVKMPRKKCPLYRRYHNRTLPQPAHLVLDPAERLAAFKVDGAHPAAPADFWQGRMLAWQVNPRLKPRVLHELESSERLQRLLTTVADGHAVYWDGRRLVGRLDEAAMAAAGEVAKMLLEIGTDEQNLYSAIECER